MLKFLLVSYCWDTFAATNFNCFQDDNELLTKQEVKEKFNVSDTTLWLWAKKNYLVSVKIGRKVMYRTSDIKQLVNGKI